MRKILSNLSIIFLVVGTLGLFPAVFSQAAPPTIDCDTDDWADISPLGHDCNEPDIDDDVDLKEGYATHDADYLYLRLDVYGNINISGTTEYYFYLDTDQSSSTGFTGETGWTTGADYRVLLNKSDNGLQKFMGENQSDDKWGWGGVPSAVKAIDIKYCKGTIECAVLKVDIGETKEYDEATNIMFRIWPSWDAIPYYDVLPLTYYCSTRSLSNDLVIDNFEYLTDNVLNSVYGVEPGSGTSLELRTTSEGCWEGSYCTEMTYSLNGRWSMVRMVRQPFGPEDWSKHKNISLWVKGYSGSTENFLVYIIESDGDEWFYQSDKVLINDAWTKFIIPLSDLNYDIYRGGNKGDGIKTLNEVVGYRIAIHDITDDSSSPTDKSIYIDNFIRKDGSLSPSHPIPDVDNYVVYYGTGRVKDLSKFDLVIIQSGKYSAGEIEQIKETGTKGTKVLVYVSLGEEELTSCTETSCPNICEPNPPGSGDEKGPISSGVLTYKGDDSRYLDECTRTIEECNVIVTCDQNDGEPDRNTTWGGYYINAGNKGWQNTVINSKINSIINNEGADGVFLDTIGVPEELIAGNKPYEWTTPGMISMIAAMRKAYPNIYIMANRGFYLFENFEEYVNALMFESFTSSHKSFKSCSDVTYEKWGLCDLAYTANLANQVNTIRGYPDQTTINVVSLDYCAAGDTGCADSANARAKEFGFISSVSDVCLSKMYMVNPANDLFAARIGPNSVLLSWIAPPEYVADADVDCYIIKKSTNGPIDTDDKWNNADLVSECVSSSTTSFLDNDAPSCQVYYALEAVKVGGMPLIGRLQSPLRPIAVDGDTADWDWLGIPPLVNDPPDDPLPPAIMEDNDVDIKAGYATHDADYLFLRLDVYGNINRDYLYLVYLDTDQNSSTGLTHNWWLTGADYRVYIDQSNMSLQKFMGADQNDDIWGWDGVLDKIKPIPIAYSDSTITPGTIEYAVPRTDIEETAQGDALNILWRTIPSDDSTPFFNAMPVTYTLDPECIPGDTQSCDTCKPGICALGTQTCSDTGNWGECIQEKQPSEEICDDKDNDCDGDIDEECVVTINLNSSWNLISLCVEPEDTAIDTVLAPISGKYIKVWAYHGGDDNPWKVYDPANPGFSDLLMMQAGWGYWINMTESTTLTVSGSAPSNSIDLVNGWNLVGYNSCDPQSVADALASCDGKYVSVWAYVNGAWKVYDPANPGFSDLTTMEPNYGYWIKTTEACTWTLP